MATTTRNRPARKTPRTESVTAHKLRPGDRLVGWGTRAPVVVLEVRRLGQRTWSVTVGLPAGAGVETAEFAAGERITRAL